MDRPPRVDALPLRQARQFSLRELLVLTFAASLILAIGVSSRGSEQFGAFSSPWALAALAPIVGVLIDARFQLLSSRVRAMVAIAFYVASLCTPAIGLNIGSSSTIWGFQALYFCLWIFGELVFDVHESWSVDQIWGPVVYLMGNLANIAFVASVILFFVRSKNLRTFTFCRRVALLGAVMAIVILMAFVLDGGIKEIYPGYGLWLASFLALAFAAGPMQRNPPRP
jgi:hypothetical protein